MDSVGLAPQLSRCKAMDTRWSPYQTAGSRGDRPLRPTRQRNRLKDLLSMYLPDEFTMMFK